ncbi:hypothetical protein HGM15179_019919 [Zosterops borbonicus]|uniref:RNA-directed DNA polymerase n=1 Tax=Zosterops borbonicus TaxID=364589 RepID=A0A8K1D920_9PASS|nr:hypothetical protein HGM15179_019919 [Zosterops borbonicus]
MKLGKEGKEVELMVDMGATFLVLNKALVPVGSNYVRKQGIALGILAQDLGPYRRAVAYVSKQLDAAAKGWPGCLRAVAAVVLNIQEARKFTLGQKMTVLLSHTLSSVLETEEGHWLSPQQFLKYQAIMVEQDDVEIVVTNIVNPASFLSGNQGEPIHHDCLETIEATCSSCSDLKDTPLNDAETWFKDGSNCHQWKMTCWIIRCDFLYLAPVVSHQLIKSNHTMYHKLSPAHIEMNLTLVRQLIKHQDIVKILKDIQETRKKTLITVHHDTKEINKVLQRVKQDHPQGKEEKSRPTGTAATQNAAEPEEQPMLVAVTPIQKKKSKTKSVYIERDEKEAGPSEEEKDAGPEIITQSLSLAWDFPREQIQNPAEVERYLKENCHDDSKEKKLIVISWALAYAYHMLVDTIGQQIEAGGQGDKSADTPVTQAALNTPVAQIADKPDREPKPMAFAPTMKKKHKAQTDHPVDDDDLYMRQTQWKTIVRGIQRLTEMAVTEIVFTDDPGMSRNPDAGRDMIEACSRIGTTEEKNVDLAEVMVVALKPLVQHGKSVSLKCFRCGKVGQKKSQCKPVKKSVVKRMEWALLKEVQNRRLWQLFLQLWQLLNSHRRDYFITHIRSHSGLMEGLALGNEKADQLVAPLWASALPNIDKFAQARRAHEFFHQGAKILHKQFGISLQDARGIVTTCPQCQGMIGGLSSGVNPCGLGLLQLWQADVTIYASFGCFKCIHVTVDTFSAMVWATPMTSEGSHFVIRHLQGCFAVMGLPQEIKMDNGPGYVAQ